MLDLDTYPIDKKIDRDVELPNLFDFLSKVKDEIDSAIDVGAQFSANYYAQHLRLYVSKYWALDPTPDPEVEKIVDKYIQKDAFYFNFPPFDLVLCVSTLEHVGQYPIKYKDYKERRFKIFQKMLGSAQKYLWLSIPVGRDHICPGQMAIFGFEELKKMAALLKPFKTKIGYFWSEGPQAGHPWTKSTFDRVIDQPYIDSLGNRGICIMEVEK